MPSLSLSEFDPSDLTFCARKVLGRFSPEIATLVETLVDWRDLLG